MLVDEIKRQMMAAMKAKDEVTKEVLSVALGEIQMGGVRAEKDLTDDEAQAILRKLVKSNEETLAAAGDGPQAATLRRENEVLRAFLPKGLDEAAILAALEPVREAIRAAKSDGQATGVAMKQLKTSGAVAESNDVVAVVKKLRV